LIRFTGPELWWLLRVGPVGRRVFQVLPLACRRVCSGVVCVAAAGCRRGGVVAVAVGFASQPLRRRLCLLAWTVVRAVGRS